MTTRTRILDHLQVKKKIDRMAYEIFENCQEDQKVFLVGIARRGFSLAQLIQARLESISKLKVVLVELKLQDSITEPKLKGAEAGDMKGAAVVLVDDVLNSGNSLMRAASGLMSFAPKRLMTAVLVDRHHRLYPIRVDIVGLTLSTTMKEHIEVEFGQKPKVYLR